MYGTMSNVLLRTTYRHIQPADAFDDVELPLQLDGLVDRISAELAREGDTITLTVVRTLDAEMIELAPCGYYTSAADGSLDEHHGIRIKEDGGVHEAFVADLRAALTFIVDRPAFLARLREDEARFIAESQTEATLLSDLGTDRPCDHWSASLAVRTFNAPVSRPLVQELLERRVGLRIYALALSHQTDEAQFRDFWRVLESAFRATGVS